MILNCTCSSFRKMLKTPSSGASVQKAGGAGDVYKRQLSGSATAPIAGVVSADNSTFYVGTSGDNLVHIITRSPLTDSSTLAPNLTTPAGAIVPVNLMVQKPRKTT